MHPNMYMNNTFSYYSFRSSVLLPHTLLKHKSTNQTRKCEGRIKIYMEMLNFRTFLSNNFATVCKIRPYRADEA